MPSSSGRATARRYDVTPEAQADRQKRLDYFLDMHARSRAHVPGEYRGEEQGIIDVVPEASPANEVYDLGPHAPVALGALREDGMIGTPLGENAAEAESNARLTLAARSMPADQIETVIARARSRAERSGVALADVLEEILSAAPGRVA
jgi:hypothetical protein